VHREALRGDEGFRGFGGAVRAREDGFFAAGYLAYELCYALEPRLAPLMPACLPTPLLWFGLFRFREELEGPKAAA
jgi:hypothetical protein